MYKGKARWSEIRAVVEALDIPVLGNGDISCAQDAYRMKDETGCAGIMIARGSHGDPWIFREARAVLDGKPSPPEPDLTERLNICLEHAGNAIAFGGDPQRAIVDFRKHLGWYTKGLPDGRELRTKLFQTKSLSEVKTLLGNYLQAYEGVHL